MTVTLACPHDDTDLNRDCDRTYWCPTCHNRFVVSITNADHRGGFNTRAPFAQLVIDIDRIFRHKATT